MNNYSYQGKEEEIAKALGKDLPISTKQSIEICAFIRKKEVSKIIPTLDDIINKKTALPMTKFNCGGTGHKKGKIGPGRYPEKALTEIKNLILSAKSNANAKGMNESNLIITYACAQRGAQRLRQGRQKRRVMKRTHVEIILAEKGIKKND